MDLIGSATPGKVSQVVPVHARKDLFHLWKYPGGFDQLSVCFGGYGKALGIFTPREVSCRYISPSDAFFPPTKGTSSMVSSSNQRI